MSKFYVRADRALQVKDVGGKVLLGPFLPGTHSEGPWYDVSALPEFYLDLWGRARVIEVIE
jgi:hypothetical protein